MFRTKVTETSAPAGFAPAGKPGNTNQPRRRVAAVILRASAAWLACGLAAMGMATAQAPAWSEAVLFDFANYSSKGAAPYAGVVRDSAGNLYGTTQGGGSNIGLDGFGVVYKMDPAGHERVLYTFTGGPDGGSPYGGVIGDSAGNLYGTAYDGGITTGYYGAGVVFKVDSAGKETVLYSFTGGAVGSNPYAGVIRDSAGDLYGTTLWGGTADEGVGYKLNAAGQETVLHSFTGGADGGAPRGRVSRDSAGNLYGVTDSGGTANAGVVYKVNTAGQETGCTASRAGPMEAAPSTVRSSIRRATSTGPPS